MLDQIQQFPESNRDRGEGYRVGHIDRFHYLLFYRISEAEKIIWITHIYAPGQDWNMSMLNE